MTEVISIRFKNGSKQYYFAPNNIQAITGEALIVETAQGLELVRCSMGNHKVPDGEVVQPLRPVVRKATAHDLRAERGVKKREEEAFVICQKKILAHGLEMKLVRVESNFDGSKMTFFFTADGRVDFRELVKDLAFSFRARIELRQIGVRDEAKMLGGLGICGQPFCCSRFLDDFIPVSIKMAKTQNLSLNPTKISGTCGRLMCCLKYEQDAYEDAARRLPKNESFVQTPDGLGNVVGVDYLREEVSVKLDGTVVEVHRRYPCQEVRVLRVGKGSREGVEIPTQPLPKRQVEELSALEQMEQEEERRRKPARLSRRTERTFERQERTLERKERTGEQQAQQTEPTQPHRLTGEEENFRVERIGHRNRNNGNNWSRKGRTKSNKTERFPQEGGKSHSQHRRTRRGHEF